MRRPLFRLPYAVSIIRIRQTPKKPGESDDSTEPGIIKRFARTLGVCNGLIFGSHKKDEEKTAARPVQTVQPARPAESAEFPLAAFTSDAPFVEPARTDSETVAEEAKTENAPALEPATKILAETRVETKSEERAESRSEAPPEAAEPGETRVEVSPEESGKAPAVEREIPRIDEQALATTVLSIDTFEKMSDVIVLRDPSLRSSEAFTLSVDSTKLAASTSAPAVETTSDELHESDEPAKLDPAECLRAALLSGNLEKAIVASLGELDLNITRPLGNEMLDLAIASDCPLLEVWTRYVVMRDSAERSASRNVWTEMLVTDIRNNRISDLVRHLSYGANPNGETHIPGEPTAIEIALQCGHKPLAEKLLDWGACIPQSVAFPLFRRATARRLAGKTPEKLPDEFMLAAAMENQPLVIEFLSLGVSPGARSAEGRTPADFARLAGHVTLAAFLEERFSEYVKTHPEKAPRPFEAVKMAETICVPTSELKPEPVVEPKTASAVTPKSKPQIKRSCETLAPAPSFNLPGTVESDKSEKYDDSDDADDFGLEDFGLDGLALDDLIPDAPAANDPDRPGTSILTSTRDVQRRHAGDIATGREKRLGEGTSDAVEVRAEAETEPEIEVVPETISVAKTVAATIEHEDSADEHALPDRIVRTVPADRSALYERWAVAHWASIGERIFLRALKSLPVDEAVKADFIAVQRSLGISDASADANGEAFRMLKLYCDDLIDPNTFR